MNHQSVADSSDDWAYTEKCALGKHVVGGINNEVWFNRRQIKYLSVDSVKTLSDTLKRYIASAAEKNQTRSSLRQRYDFWPDTLGDSV